MVKLFSVKSSNKRICCVSNNPSAVNPFLTIQMNMSVFFLDCPKTPFWSMLSLNSCRLFKIYTSYIISKCRSVKMINIPRLWVRHFHLLSVQSYKRLKLRAFKEWLFRKNNATQIRVFTINTFASVLMFILRELKNILVYLQKNSLYEKHRNDYSIPHNIFAIGAWKKIYFVELIFAM